MTARVSGRLADGREIIYFDRAPGRRPAPDERDDLPRVSPRSEIRWNPLFGDYAVIAAHRQDRTYRPPSDRCPLCPSRPGQLTEVPERDYEVVVFENRFPSLSEHIGYAEVPPLDDPPFRSGPGLGRCEVVSFTSDHDAPFSSLSPAQVRTVIDAWADRTTALSAIDSVEYVFCFENRGEEIGVTLSHPHGQIYGYPFVPARFGQVADALERHRAETGRCLQCDLLATELEHGERIVVETGDWVVYVPFAARWPYEVRIVPRRHQPDLPGLSDAERDDLARVYLHALQAFDGLFPAPAPYIAGWQQAPVRGVRESWHLAAEIFTIRRAENKLKYLAGSESAATVWVNDVTPEAAAERLRNAFQKHPV